MAEYTIHNVSSNTYVITKSEAGNSEDWVLYTGPNKDGSKNINTISIGGNRVIKKDLGIFKRKELTVIEVLDEVNKFAPDIDPEVKRSVGDHLGRRLRVGTETVEKGLGIRLGDENAGASVEVKKTTEVK